ncbi:Calx-beta domain-containing protein, partial [Hyella patelloides]|uniref:Calx-beta domain-containing protein n=1 Tax=Hyella patelloides TaxID=1982969 RepID=UPI001643C5EB
FNPGVTERTISIDVIGDNIEESVENFNINLSNALGAVIVDNQGIGTIVDDDGDSILTPSISINDVTIVEGDDETTTAVLTLNLSYLSNDPITVDYTTTDGTAIAGEDYSAISGTLTFNPGETQKTVEIEVIGNILNELDEAFYLQLSNPTNVTIPDSEAVVAVVDNDALPDLAVDSVTISESDTETSQATFNVTLTNPSSLPITVKYTTENGTAIAGEDYQAVSGTLTFEPGETNKTVTVDVIEDDLDEFEQSFSLNLTNPTNATISQGKGIGTIIDNDAPPGLNIADLTVIERNEGASTALIAVTLDGASNIPITVDYATVDGTAMAGLDYQAITGTLTFEPGTTEKFIEVSIFGDTVEEITEAFSIELSNPQYVTLENTESTVSIQNNDLLPSDITLSLANDTGLESTDYITSDPTINGAINNLPEAVTLQAQFAGMGGDFTDISSLIGEDGSFTLDLASLESIYGSSLDSGSYALQLVLTDSNTGSFSIKEITFTYDNTTPTISLITPLSDGDHSNTARIIGEVDEALSVTYSVDGGAVNNLPVSADGKLDQELGNLSVGEHTTTLTATDIAGNVTTTDISFLVGETFDFPDGTTGWGAKNADVILLGERDSYVVETTLPVELGLEIDEEGETIGERTLSFDLDLLWDETDIDHVLEDQLLVYLVDPNNPSQTILDNGTAGTAVFSLAGEETSFTPGLVTFDGRTVKIDVTSLPELTEGLLVFQLLNQDTDLKSLVKVSNFNNEVDLEGRENLFFADNPRIVAAGGTLDLTEFSNSTTIEPVIDNVRFDSTTGKYQARLRVKNSGDAIGRNVAVVFDDLPDGIELTNASGTDEAGNPYLNLRDAILSGGLDRGAISDAVTINFDNPNLTRFGLKTRVLTKGVNQAPNFAPIAAQTVMPGAKVTIPLEATDPDGDIITFAIKNTGNLPTGKLGDDSNLILTPTAEDIGSYQITVVASDGFARTEQTFSVDVLADPITTTRISGVIENVEQEPLAGVVIELGDLQTVTAADGSFTIETNQPLTADTLLVRGELMPGDEAYPYIAEKLPLVLGQDVQAGFNNIIDRPIYLPALDVASGEVIDPNVDVTVTTENIPGAAVTVSAGSLKTQEGEDFTGILSITEVPIDLTPAALPEGIVPDTVVTIQPGEMAFTTPALLSLPNRAEWEAGTEMELWSINPNTGDFDVVGTGRVSDDGSVVETIDGGIRNSSWHFFVIPAPPIEDISQNQDEGCPTCGHNNSVSSEVESHSGALIETHDLVTYNSNGETRGLTLTYDSSRADPREIVNFGLETDPNFSLSDLTLSAGLFLFDGNSNFALSAVVNSWSVPSSDKPVGAALQTDLSLFPSGLYSYILRRGITNNRPLSSGTSVRDSSSTLLNVNSINSPFGSGWGLSGWQELVENFDGSVLLIDGNGEELMFDAPSNATSSVYVSPEGDFSTLEKLADGSFRRIMKDQTVYTFNTSLQLSSMRDRNGNETQYIYDTSNQLSKIIDPVGKTTIFTYNAAGKVKKIIDPANRETILNYDAEGNLESITDPDTATRTWEYNSRHNMIAEIDQRGNREEAYYNFAGRVVVGKQKDGSNISIASVQSANLEPPGLNTDAKEFSEEIFSTYADGNGNVTVTQLDSAGQAISGEDGEGRLSSRSRNDDNLITVSYDGRGNRTDYDYDERGNLIRVEDSSFSSPAPGTAASLFSEPVEYDIYDSYFADDTAVLEDINQDGILDIIGFDSNNRGTLTVNLGNENGNFVPEFSANNVVPSWKIELGDINNDTFLDIVNANFGRPNVSVFLGNGDGSFSNPTYFGSDELLQDLELGDFNNDGNLDLVFPYALLGNPNVSVLIGNGDGTFTSEVDYPINEFPQDLELGDFNSDGFVDIVVASQSSNNISVLMGNGDGTFAPKVDY